MKVKELVKKINRLDRTIDALVQYEINPNPTSDNRENALSIIRTENVSLMLQEYKYILENYEVNNIGE